jgi:hypothetical protein
MKLAVKSCAYDLVGALEHLEPGWTLLSVSVRPLVPLTDLAGNRGLVSADLRLWESRSDFQANCCWRRRLQISKFHRYMTQYVGVDNSGGRTARNVPD